MPTWVEQGINEYRKRLVGDIRLDIIEIPIPKRGNTNVATLIKKEAELLKKQLQKWPQARYVALEVNGKAHSTESLAKRITAIRDMGQDIVLLIGGPDGLCSELSQQCHEHWSLSALTLPHPVVRVVLAEQVYRVWSLLNGHPYHR